MGLSADAGFSVLSPDQGLESRHWAENEFGGAPLGDARLSKRLVRVAEDKAAVPSRAYSDKCDGLGELVTNQTGAKRRELYLHSTLAVALNGLPLGVLRAQCIAPKGKAPEKKRPAYASPIEEKKTFSWIDHHRDLVSLSAKLPHTRLVHVCDREADFFEMFAEQRRNSCVELLVRAKHKRSIKNLSNSSILFARRPFRV